MNTILLALFVGLCCGLLIGACLRPRGHRLPSTAYFNRRNDTEPKIARWTPFHGRSS